MNFSLRDARRLRRAGRAPYLGRSRAVPRSTPTNCAREASSPPTYRNSSRPRAQAPVSFSLRDASWLDRAGRAPSLGRSRAIPRTTPPPNSAREASSPPTYRNSSRPRAQAPVNFSLRDASWLGRAGRAPSLGRSRAVPRSTPTNCAREASTSPTSRNSSRPRAQAHGHFSLRDARRLRRAGRAQSLGRSRAVPRSTQNESGQLPKQVNLLDSVTLQPILVNQPALQHCPAV